MVSIIIPVYKEIPDKDDFISLNQLFKVLGKYKIIFVHPKSLNLNAYKNFGALFIGFDDIFFKNIHGYNTLMMNKLFYQSFSEKYLLIYQTDCFVFRDELMEWCEKDYDYIGAPWLRRTEKIPLAKLIVDRGISKAKSTINYKRKGKHQKDKSLLYNKVGNGGFSLRKREKFIEILETIPNVANIYLNPKHSNAFYAEDVFFSIEPERNNITFLKPSYQEACLFSIENNQKKAMEIIAGKLPFGCHRWTKEKHFWKEFFKNYNVEI